MVRRRQRQRRQENSSSGGDGGEVLGLRSTETPTLSGKELLWGQIRHSEPKPCELGRTRRCRLYGLVAVTDVALDYRGLLGRDLGRRSLALDASSSLLPSPVFLPGPVFPGLWEEGS